jgi:hypothetical protein
MFTGGFCLHKFITIIIIITISSSSSGSGSSSSIDIIIVFLFVLLRTGASVEVFNNKPIGCIKLGNFITRYVTISFSTNTRIPDEIIDKSDVIRVGPNLISILLIFSP